RKCRVPLSGASSWAVNSNSSTCPAGPILSGEEPGPPKNIRGRTAWPFTNKRGAPEEASTRTVRGLECVEAARRGEVRHRSKVTQARVKEAFISDHLGNGDAERQAMFARNRLRSRLGRGYVSLLNER